MAKGTDKETVDVEEASRLMEVHPETVKEYILAGVLPAAKLGRKWVMMRRDVIRHVEAQIIAQTAARTGKNPRNAIHAARLQHA